MKDFRIRCSALGNIMANPTAAAVKAGKVLSAGAETWIRALAREDIFGVEVTVSTKYTEKGLMVEQDSIDLYNRVHGTMLVKNTERRTDDILTGEADLVGNEMGVDIKSSWSVATFPILPSDCEDSLYLWQARGYMRLWNLPRWQVAYCLVDTPDKLIGFEPLPLHIVSHIPEHLRVTTWTIERDMEAEALMVQKVHAARAYYAEVIAEFDRQHVESMPIVDPGPSSQPQAAPVSAAELPAELF